MSNRGLDSEEQWERRRGEGREIVAVGAMLQGQTDRRTIDGKIIDFMEDRHSDTHTHRHGHMTVSSVDPHLSVRSDTAEYLQSISVFRQIRNSTSCPRISGITKPRVPHFKQVREAPVPDYLIPLLPHTDVGNPSRGILGHLVIFFNTDK